MLRGFSTALLLMTSTMNSQVPVRVFSFAVPNALMDVEGNEGSLAPFSDIRPVRHQQVYDASQFSRVPAAGAFITRIFIRADCGKTWAFLSTNLQLNFSTTPKGPDQLSSVFAENIGSDETVVWRRAQYSPPAGGSATCPEGFSGSHSFYLDVPFFYDPAKGNLFDLRKGGTEHTGGLLEWSQLDAQNVMGDSVSRAVAFSLTSNTAELVDSVGLVTEFEFFATPTLYPRYETNNLVLSWGWTTQPQTFRLQWTDRVEPGQAWTDYPGEMDRVGPFTYAVVLPATSLGNRKYFRLFWDTPQPLGAPLATAPVALDSIKNP
jgi:hypothetical protein